MIVNSDSYDIDFPIENDEQAEEPFIPYQIFINHVDAFSAKYAASVSSSNCYYKNSKFNVLLVL